MHKNFVKFGRVGFELCEGNKQTDRKADRHTQYNTTQYQFEESKIEST